jgi:unsaturated rhamnogalacturonyl hydrolase
MKKVDYNEINLVAKKMMNLAHKEIEEQCPIGIVNMENWEWPQGVGLYSLYKVYQDTKDQEIFTYLIEWFDRRIKEGLPEKNVNTMAPMLTLAYLLEETNNEQYLNLCKEWAAWIMTEMPRTEDGGLQHIVSGFENEGQLWDDTLYMTVLFLAKIGKMLNQYDYMEEAEHQFLVHIKYLYDKKTGLWFHGWSFIEKSNFANALWGRGNCWFTAGVVDYIEMMDLSGGTQQFLLDTLEAQVKKLMELQTKEGMWHTLLDDTTSYVETSATAGFAYGILKAIRKGYLSTKYLEVGLRACNAVRKRILSDGIVDEVSYGTGMGHTLQAYKDIEKCPMAYGQALTVLMLCEQKRID